MTSIHKMSLARIPATMARPLLEACHLPLAGLESTTLLCLLEDGEIVGVAGIETYGDAVLLRSVATEEAHRGKGVARYLCTFLLDEARARGAERAFLLTETAESYFADMGFETVPREAADPRLLVSAEFQEGRCAGARLMSKRL